ncbi:hypothetical protein [uncultured Bacteroides sp.]|uniref:hypothetical protein n=1 Tax=uncultured Bacteroides sp. TaxID=162156 RepID=UPI0026666CA9|nr:hypothetical protein [uncultured Bacteroides sp.]
MLSCVDSEYDLSKDLDMTVTVGGENLTIPASNTKNITLEKIFDLNEESTVKADADGNYALSQTGKGSNTRVSIEEITIKSSEIALQSARTELNYMMSPSGTLEATVNDKTSFSIDKRNITTDVTELYSSDVIMPASLRMNIEGSNSLTLKKGFQIEFPDYMTITTTDQRVKITGSVLTFIQDINVSQNSALYIPIQVTRIDFESMGTGKGLVAPGHLVIADDINISGTSTTTGGSAIQMIMDTEIKIDEIQLTQVTAKVNPEINVSIDPITINNLPDFLKDEQVRIDMTDPKIYLTVSNTSPVEVNFSGVLKSYKGGKLLASVPVGQSPNLITIPGNQPDEYIICLHRLNNHVEGADASVTVENLNDLIETIPDEIRMDNIEAKASDKRCTIVLGSTYNVKTDYEINAPLQFNEGTNIVYSDVIDNWNKDVKDLSVKEVVITMDAQNSIPLTMNMEVKAINKNGTVLNSISTEVSSQIAAGTMENAKVTPLKITLKSTDANAFKELDGLKYEVSATSSAETSGKVLNKNQYLRLENMTIKIKGGVTVDMN